MTTEQSCWFCQDDRGADAPVGGWLHDDASWRVGHVPAGWAPAGTVVVEAQRHFLDFADMDDRESATFAPLLGRLFGVVKTAVGAERVYLWSTMDRFPHFHVWLLPWWQRSSTRGPAYLVDATERGGCSEQEAVDAANAIRQSLG